MPLNVALAIIVNVSLLLIASWGFFVYAIRALKRKNVRLDEKLQKLTAALIESRQLLKESQRMQDSILPDDALGACSLITELFPAYAESPPRRVSSP